MNYLAVRGEGDPNGNGAYQQAIGVLYSVAYTLKMSYKTDYRIEGFFEYVVPPLEGFWWQDGVKGIDYGNKDAFRWISVIRLPDFVTEKDFAWAVETAAAKKGIDCSPAEFLTVDEGLCVQAMHVGPFDDEPATVALMDRHVQENGRQRFRRTQDAPRDIPVRPKEVAPEKLKTVVRHPIRKADRQTAARDRKAPVPAGAREGPGCRDSRDGAGAAYFGTQAHGIARRLGAPAPRSVGGFRRPEAAGTYSPRTKRLKSTMAMVPPRLLATSAV